MKVKEISDTLSLIAKLMTIAGENTFKIKAFENASRVILRLEHFEKLINEKKLSNVKGIGKSIEAVIEELYNTDSCALLEELEKKVPGGLKDMLSLKGLGAKKIRELSDKLGIQTIGELEYACNENRLRLLKGFGKKTEENILNSIFKFKQREKILHYPEAKELGKKIIKNLYNDKIVGKAAITGELRRKCEIINVLEIVVEIKNMNAFENYLLATGKIEFSSDKKIICKTNNVNLMFHLANKGNFHKILFETTGSKKFLLSIKSYSPYSEEEINSERKIFKHNNINFVPPECREYEYENYNYRALINYNDLQGLFHIHTTYSDGADSIENIVRFLINRGYSYVGISDHSQSAYYANGLSPDDIKRQHEEIDILNEKYKPFKIFKGIESDILKNGDLDYNDSILESFDFVIASVHSSFNLSEKEMTERIVKAVENPYTTVIGHPTGRLLLYRDAYKLNIEKFLQAVAENKKYIEINSHPYRLDFSWENCLKARESDIKFFITPDAHNMESFSYVKYGINVARKALLNKNRIINTSPLEEITSLLF